MRNSKKAMLAGMAAAAAGIGIMAAKRQREHNKSPYQKFLDKIDEYLD